MSTNVITYDSVTFAASPTNTSTFATSANPVFTGNVSMQGEIRTYVSLTDAATIATNAALGSFFTVTIAASRTLGNPTNATDGQTYEWRIIQDGTGGWTITLDTNFQLGSNLTTPVLATAANSVSYLAARYYGATGKWHVTGFRTGFS